MQSEKDGKRKRNEKRMLFEILFRLKEKIISKCHKIVNVKLFDFLMSLEG